MSSGILPDAEETSILLVDDNLMTRTLTISMLEHFGFRDIDYAVSGMEAWEKIVKMKSSGRLCDVILLDWNMPGMSGYDLLRRCREDRGLDDIAIIMLTAENQKRNMLEAIKAGATSYITKPIAHEELFAKLSQAVAWKKKVSDCAV